MRSWILAGAMLLSAPLATAQVIQQPRLSDTVNMSLSLESWVETQTARTELAVDATLPGSDAGKVRENILGAVKMLAQGAEWRFTRFDHDQDTSGLEHWHGVVEARLPEAQLGGLSDRAKQASKPGLQIKIQTVDFSPTLAETQATEAKLRGEMYKKVNEALAQLNQAEPDRKYRITNINFNTGQQPIYANANVPTAMLREKASDGDGVDLSHHLQIRANVNFGALAPLE